MTAARVHVARDHEAASRAAAEEFVRQIADRSRNATTFVALSGGSTPKRMYQMLAGDEFRPMVTWGQVHFFWSDERPVPPTDPDSNYRMASEALLQPLGIAPGQIHRMRGEDLDLPAAARAYEEEMARAFGVQWKSHPPRFDLVLLGLGADGHTASLFPRTVALQERRHWVVANPVPQLRTTRLTMTYPVLNAARCVLFLVTGRDKAEAVARVFSPTGAVEEVPARGVCPHDGELVWFLDEAAARRLDG
ncbi:MAG: 6-phosphogluconolactonase [Candidatus Binatia bacterium]|nr:6-phosphogluconolactonase [Candidatus Binatia bacterium]